VEDSPDDAELTLRALRKNNISNKVVIVRDGVEALDFLFGRGAYHDRDLSVMPALILLDIKLPKIDGFEVLRCLRSDPRTRYLPVVILTGSKEERDLVKGYELGCNSYILKPVDFAKFKEAVGKIGSYWLQVNQTPSSGGNG